MSNIKFLFNCKEANEAYSMLLNKLIFSHSTKLKSELKNEEINLQELLKYFEKKEDYESCFVIYEVIKSFVLDYDFIEPFLEKEDDDDIYFNWLYKCVLLSIIYFNQDNEEESRYQYIDGIGVVQQMKKYFENISQNYKVEILKQIIKYLSGIKKYNLFNLLW